MISKNLLIIVFLISAFFYSNVWGQDAPAKEDSVNMLFKGACSIKLIDDSFINCGDVEYSSGEGIISFSIETTSYTLFFSGFKKNRHDQNTISLELDNFGLQRNNDSYYDEVPVNGNCLIKTINDNSKISSIECNATSDKNNYSFALKLDNINQILLKKN